jgi:aspartokinase/homoserine dehydrogenase 1
MHSKDTLGQSHKRGFGIPTVDSCGPAIDAPHSSAQPLGKRAARSNGSPRLNVKMPDGSRKASKFFSERFLHRCQVQGQIRACAKKPLRVMKFGGTSVGDASCIGRVVEIVRAASRESNVVVVVSAMSGVTNKLVEAASQLEAGNGKRVATIFKELRERHDAVISALIHSAAARTLIDPKIQEIFQEGESLCRGILLRELTQPIRDAIASLGERLSAPLIAAALVEKGVASQSIEATELVVTNSDHGGAEPRTELTRERCEARLRPLLQQGIIPVVTGFIGATTEGVLTTLGRGGSDYSATILSAALDADEVIIWTDVDGLMTADPRLVPGACTIPEISYREAAELAYFGAKVLHPKTLRPLMQTGIPLWILNTFSPERRGTRITPTGLLNGGGVKALSAFRDTALITVPTARMLGVRDVSSRTFSTAAAVRTDVLLILQPPSRIDIRFLVPSALANRTVEALRREFAQELAHEKVDHITQDPTVAIIAIVGEGLKSISGIAERAVGTLARGNVDIIAVDQGPSECSISLVVAQKDIKAALGAIHGEFQLGAQNSPELRARSSSASTGKWEPTVPRMQVKEEKIAQSMD